MVAEKVGPDGYAERAWDGDLLTTPSGCCLRAVESQFEPSLEAVRYRCGLWMLQM